MDNVLGNIAARTGTFVWHGKATYLDENDPVPMWQVASGADFDINTQPLYYRDAEGNERKVEDRVALIRGDNGDKLGIVSPQFKVVQPDTMVNLMTTVCREVGLSMRTMGVLGLGEKFWALADVGKDALFLNGHEHRAHFLFATGCNGTLKTLGKLTDVCTVCENTLAAARGSDGGEIKISHRSTFDPDAMIKALGLYDVDAAWLAFSEQMRKLADVTNITDNQAQQFYTELLSPKRTPQDDLEGRRVRGMDKLMGAYRSAPGADPGSLYGVVQGMTRFIDHERGGAKNRMNSAWFGQGNTLKTATLNKAIELAEAA